MITAFIFWSAVIPAIGALLIGIGRLIVVIRRLFERVDEFIDDWRGTPPRPGVPRRPGVMERLEWIEHQLTPNSGHSLRDAVNRIEHQVSTPSGES